MLLTFVSPKNLRQRLELSSWFMNPFRPEEILTFDVQHPWIKDNSPVAVPGYRVACFRSSAAGRKQSLGAPMGFYKDLSEMRQLLFADFPRHVHTGQPIDHPLVAVIPDGEIGAGSVIVKHTGRVRSPEIPSGMKDHVEVEAFVRQSALKSLESLGYVLDTSD